MLSSFTPRIFSWENLVFKNMLLWRRVLSSPNGMLGFVLFSVVLYLLWKVELPNNTYWTYAKPLSGMVVLWYVLKILKPFSDTTQWFTTKYKSIFSFNQFDKDIGLRDEFINEISDLITPLGKVVVFIDDLDRCKDEDIFKIMQTVNYLASTKNIFIVMAVDKDRVLEAIARHYAQENGIKKEQDKVKKLAYNYLEKIFNITLRIPEVGNKFYDYKENDEYKYRLQNNEKRCIAFREHKITRFLQTLWIEWFGVLVFVGLLGYYHVDVKDSLDSVSSSLSTFIQIDNNSSAESNNTKGTVAYKNITEIVATKKIVEANITKPIVKNKDSFSRPSSVPAHKKAVVWYENIYKLIGLIVFILFFLFLIAIIRREQVYKKEDIKKIRKLIKKFLSWDCK